jgi:hypothetical protein
MQYFQISGFLRIVRTRIELDSLKEEMLTRLSLREASPRSLGAVHERRKNLSYMLSDIGQLNITRIAVHMSDGFYLYKDLFQTLDEITLYETWAYPLRERFSSIEPLKLKFKDLESYEDQHYAIKWHGGGKYFSNECALLGCIDTLEEFMEPDKQLSDEYSKGIGSRVTVKKAFMELKGLGTDSIHSTLFRLA